MRISPLLLVRPSTEFISVLENRTLFVGLSVVSRSTMLLESQNLRGLAKHFYTVRGKIGLS